jgi:hypothetical protein
VLHGPKFQKTSLIVNRRESIPEYSVLRPLIVSLYGESDTLIQLWNAISLRAPKDGDDMFCETLV